MRTVIPARHFEEFNKELPALKRAGSFALAAPIRGRRGRDAVNRKCHNAGRRDGVRTLKNGEIWKWQTYSI